MKHHILVGSLSVLPFLALSTQSMAQPDEFTVNVGGRLHIEYTAADFDNPDSSIDGTEVRRARIKASGNFNSDTKYKVEFNTSTGGSVDIEDAYVQYALPGSFVGGTKWKVKLGHFKTQNSLEEDASSNTNHTIERAAFTDAFGLNRRAGIELATGGDNFTFKVGAFTTNINSDNSLQEGRAYAARVTFTPINTDENLVHLGASWRYRDQPGDSLADIDQGPFTAFPSGDIVQTADFSANDNFYGFELAAIHDKKLWAWGEYALLDVNAGGFADNGTAFEDATLPAFAAEVGYLFGGQQGYKGGKFTRTKVDNPVGDGGWGAFSVVARYDHLDLSDAPPEFDGTTSGGQLDTFVVGANWWMTNYSRIAINYFNVDADNDGAPTFAAGASNPAFGDSGQGIVTRLQLDF